jgi:hypothetical protein
MGAGQTFYAAICVQYPLIDTLTYFLTLWDFFWDPNGGSMNITVSIRKIPKCRQIGRIDHCYKEVFKPYIISANTGPVLQTWTMPPREIDVASGERQSTCSWCTTRTTPKITTMHS